MHQGEAINAVYKIAELAERMAAFWGLLKGSDYDVNVVFSCDPDEADKEVIIGSDIGIPTFLGILEVNVPGHNEPTVAIIPCLTLAYFADEDVLSKVALMLSDYIRRIVSDETHHTIEMLYALDSLTAIEVSTAETALNKLGQGFAEGLGLAFGNDGPYALD